MNPDKRQFSLPDLKGPMHEIISRIPQGPGVTRRQLDAAITKELKEIWNGCLSKEQCQQKAEFDRGKLPVMPPEIYATLDAILLRQAKTLGWRIAVSRLAERRMLRWEKESHGPELFERLGKALAKSVRILHGEALPPIDNPDLVPAKEQMLPELRLIRSKIKEVFEKELHNREDVMVRTCFSAAVLEFEANCPFLKANLDRWQSFFIDEPALLSSYVFTQHAAPGALFDEYLAWCKGHKPVTVRKKISQMRSAARSK